MPPGGNQGDISRIKKFQEFIHFLACITASYVVRFNHEMSTLQSDHSPKADFCRSWQNRRHEKRQARAGILPPDFCHAKNESGWKAKENQNGIGVTHLNMADNKQDTKQPKRETFREDRKGPPAPPQRLNPPNPKRVEKVEKADS